MLLDEEAERGLAKAAMCVDLTVLGQRDPDHASSTDDPSRALAMVRVDLERLRRDRRGMSTDRGTGISRALTANRHVTAGVPCSRARRRGSSRFALCGDASMWTRMAR